jgi:hypothetical protein
LRQLKNVEIGEVVTERVAGMVEEVLTIYEGDSAFDCWLKRHETSKNKPG